MYTAREADCPILVRHGLDASDERPIGGEGLGRSYKENIWSFRGGKVWIGSLQDRTGVRTDF